MLGRMHHVSDERMRFARTRSYGEQRVLRFR